MQRRLFIGNLDWRVTETDLSSLISAYAQVVDVTVGTDRETGRSRGFAFVTVEIADVQGLIRQLDGQNVAGRAIRVSEAEERQRRAQGGGGPRRRER